MSFWKERFSPESKHLRRRHKFILQWSENEKRVKLEPKPVKFALKAFAKTDIAIFGIATSRSQKIADNEIREEARIRLSAC